MYLAKNLSQANQQNIKTVRQNCTKFKLLKLNLQNRYIQQMSHLNMKINDKVDVFLEECYVWKKVVSVLLALKDWRDGIKQWYKC